MRRVALFCIGASLAIFGAASFAGCHSRAVNHRIGEALANEVIGQMTDLTVPAVKFRSEKGRWPEDLPELTAFVEQSGGRLRTYDRVDLTQLPGDTLQILAVTSKGTNRTTMTFHQDPSTPQ